MKTYLHRTMKILYVLPAGGFKNYSYSFKMFQHFEQLATRELNYIRKKVFFLHVIPIYFIASCLHETFKLLGLLIYYIFVLTQKKLNRDNNL